MPEPHKSKNNGKPKLVNRGGAGLYGKLTDKQRARIIPEREVRKNSLTPLVAKYQIAPALIEFAIPIDSVVFDPDNARIHPERNLDAIKQSLSTYGQLKPIVVRRMDGQEYDVVVAGNGTLKCAKELGWTKIAAVFVKMTDAEAAGYGLADNKTAELAKWDFETDVLKRLDRKIREAGLPMTGWSEHDLAVLRMADWIPPKETDEDFVESQGKITIKFTREQYAKIDEIMNEVHNEQPDKELTDSEIIVRICQEWYATVGK